MHGTDERVTTAGFAQGVTFLHQLITRLMQRVDLGG
jgi:hypothetical protein